MKKIILSLAFIGLFSFMTPMIATPLPPGTGCTTYILTCPDPPYTQHYVVCCDGEDWETWVALLCGAGAD